MGRAWACSLALQERGFAPTLLDLRFLKPLDTQILTELVCAHDYAFVFSDSYYLGGVASAIIESLLQTNAREHIAKIVSFEVRDAFVPHGRSDLVEQSLGLDTHSLVQGILKALR